MKLGSSPCNFPLSTLSDCSSAKLQFIFPFPLLLTVSTPQQDARFLGRDASCVSTVPHTPLIINSSAKFLPDIFQLPLCCSNTAVHLQVILKIWSVGRNPEVQCLMSSRLLVQEMPPRAASCPKIGSRRELHGPRLVRSGITPVQQGTQSTDSFLRAEQTLLHIW